MSEEQVLDAVDNKTLAENSFKQMVDYLENILTRQLERVRNYDLDGAMSLAEEANDLAATVGREKILERPDYADERWRIKKLYKDICLILASERHEVSEKLQQIRKGLKALGVYGENL
ncbi:MAG: hypothetical protein ACYTFK_02165 [Planctomycetota bacterium]|jgi:hypothetical protein